MAAYQKILTVICIALVAGIGMFAYRQSSVDRSPEAELASTALYSEGLGDVSLPREPALDAATSRPPMEPALKAQLFSEYRCEKSACDLSPFLAENEDEAVWLRQHGYPSERQREEAKGLSTVELKSRTDKGDLIAASLYGERLMEEGDYGRAYLVLVESAPKGNLYALYALSYRSLNQPKDPDGISARAYLRLAYLAGDHKATIQLTRTAPKMNVPVAQLWVDEYAADKYRNLMKYRSYPRPSSKY